MTHIKSFKNISIHLETFPDFINPNFFLEQYTTPITVLQDYYEFIPNDNNKTILDLGIGTGKLSKLASLLGAENIIGIDIDKSALKLARSLCISNLSLINSPVEFFPFKKIQASRKIQGVIMNPPFGTKRKFIDLVFLKKAMETRSWIISLHKYNVTSLDKIKTICENNKYYISKRRILDMELPKTYAIHLKLTYTVKVILLQLFPNN